MKNQAQEFKFSSKSEEKLKTMHVDLQKIFRKALKLSRVDFGISYGHRSPEEQRVMFDNHLSNCDGTLVPSKHNNMPSLAGDIFAYVEREATFDKANMCYIAGVVVTATKILMLQGEITHDIRWGGNWDSDGIILKDQKFQDLCHFELQAF